MDIQEQKRTSSVTLPQSVMLAKQAKREMKKNGKVTVLCPKCKSHPSVTTTSRGERTIVMCDCGYICDAEINL